MRTATTLLIAGVTIAGCHAQPMERYVDHAWVRLGAVKGGPAAAYFTVHGGATPSTLIAVTSDMTVKSEIHETTTRDTVASMRPLAGVAIPAKAKVAFQPGGRHVMFFGVNPAIKPAGTITLTLTFSDGERILQDAGVIAAGDPTPK